MAVSFKRKNKGAVSTKKHLVNNRIRFDTLRVLTNTGENLGVLKTQEALRKAMEMELDLVVISEKANPPVAKILDFSKFLYEEKKKSSAVKNKATKSETKEFVFGPSIGEGDLDKRIERTREFITEGNKVKYSIRLKGRQRAYPEIGFDKIKRATAALADTAKAEQEPELKGNIITVTFIKK